MLALSRCSAGVRVDEDGVWAGPQIKVYTSTRREQATVPALRGHGLSDLRPLAPFQREGDPSPRARQAGRDGIHAPLRWVTEDRQLFVAATGQIDEKCAQSASATTEEAILAAAEMGCPVALLWEALLILGTFFLLRTES